MIYLYWYLGIGMAISIVILNLKVDEKYWAKSTEQQNWHYILLEKVVFPVLSVALMTAIWPLIVYWVVEGYISRTLSDAARNKRSVIAEMLDPKPLTRAEILGENELVVTKTDLIERCFISEIEAPALIADPLGAVPNLPFGHLNPSWEKLKANMQDEDEIWTFKAKWDRRWRVWECRGYAILRGDNVPHNWMTGWVDIKAEESTSDA